jgi:hypothetical protein
MSNERMLDQNDPNIDTIAALQGSITATLTYIMGRASVAELFGLQGYLSTLASQMAPVEAVRHGPQAPWDEALWDTYAQKPEMPFILRQQMAEIERQTALMRAQQATCTPAQYRQES